MNSITVDQNKLEMIRLLKAKRVAYDKAKQVLFIEWISQIFSLAVPIISILAFPHIKDKQIIIITSIFTLINIVTFLVVKKRTDEGANIQEEFDTELFKTGWNETLCGDKVPINEIIDLAKKFTSKDKQTDWYSLEIAPIIRQTNAILLCQYSNLVWDMSLRRKFIKHFIIFIIIYYVGFLSYLAWQNKYFNHSISLLLPTLPFVLFSLINIFNIDDIIKEKKTLLSTTTKLFENFKLTQQETSYSKIREIQDVIYSTRKKSEKIPNWYYKIFKSKQEEDMNECVRALIQTYNLTN